MLEISLDHDNTLGCFEKMLATIAIWLDREYCLMSSDSWNFGYKVEPDSDETLGDRLYIDFERITEVTEKYLGISLNYHDGLDIQNLTKILHDEIPNGRPVCVAVDSFTCDWHPWFNQKHVNHYYLVIDQTSDEQYVCKDPMYGITFKKQPTEISIHSINFFSFDISNQYEGLVAWDRVINYSLERLYAPEQEYLGLGAMIRFGEDIAKLSSLEREVAGYSVLRMAPLFFKLHHIHLFRKKFARIMEYLAGTNHSMELLQHSKQMRLISDKWENIENLLMKAVYSRNPTSFSRIRDKILEIADLELRLADSLHDLLSDYRSRGRNQNDEIDS
jgi:hypothetical protein